MPFFKSLGREAAVRDILAMNRDAGKALVHYHLAVLRQPSALSVGERELIAAYVSALNACQYCYGVHSITARAFGLAKDTFEKLMTGIDGAPVPERLKPILRYARKLTLEPAKMVQADADAVFAAGWNEQGLHDAICVVCLFNFMNRLLDGHGVHGHDALYKERGHMVHERGYAPLLKFLE
jgi:uncharacterized peroxidase-related enzyme